MYSRGMATLISVICLIIVGAGLGIAALLGVFSPVTPADLAALGDFNRIDIAASGEMQITQGATVALAINAGPRDQRRLRAYTRDKTLFIEHRNDWLTRFVPPDDPIDYVVSVDRLDGLTMTGLANVNMDGLTADAFALVVNGMGTVEIANVDVERLKVKLASGSEATLTGVAVDQAVSIAGTGAYHAGELQSETARVQLTGDSVATLWVTLALDAELTGSGQLSYYGNPTVSKRVSGLGGVEHLGVR